MKYQKKRYWKYKLYEDETGPTGIILEMAIKTEFIEMTTLGVLTVKKNYCWDGASGPTIDTKNTMVPALFHDALYQLMRMGLLDRKWRKAVDRLFYDMLRARKTWRVRARAWYKAVRKGASKSSKYDVITVE